MRKISSVTIIPRRRLRRPASQPWLRALTASASIGFTASAAQSSGSSIVVGFWISRPPSATARSVPRTLVPATRSMSERCRAKRMTMKTASTPKISA